MEIEKCGLHRGFVYKLIPESTRTYVFYKSVKDYVMGILDQPEVSGIRIFQEKFDVNVSNSYNGMIC